MKIMISKTMRDVQWSFIRLAISSAVHFLLRVVLGRELGASGLGLYTLVVVSTDMSDITFKNERRRDRSSVQLGLYP
jgi:O-antigen/teichoic acid export membrane protein